MYLVCLLDLYDLWKWDFGIDYVMYVYVRLDLKKKGYISLKY